MSDHTPTLPLTTDLSDIWDADGYRIAIVDGRNRPEITQRAAFIVRAVNAHDALVAALERVRQATKDLRHGGFNNWEIAEELEAALGDAALAQVKGE